MSGKMKISDGDWICGKESCGNLNFARRTSCNKCGTAKNNFSQMIKQSGSEIGKNIAAKSKGLFSADDWQCSKCGNINWARRTTCNVCNAPKLKAKENRTGLGGGYMERDNVDYVEREDSDSEFDEVIINYPKLHQVFNKYEKVEFIVFSLQFGRKKKKYRGQEMMTNSKHKEKEVNKEEDNDNDDDDDDDDESFDASKYDLSASDDEDGDSLNRKRSYSSSSSSSNSSSSSSSSSKPRLSPSDSSKSGSRSRSRSPKRSRR